MYRISMMSLLFAALLTLPALGCGDDHDHDENNHTENNHDHEDNNHDHEDNNHDHEDGEEHACVHFESGPNVEIMSVADGTATLNETFEEHTRIDVMLPTDADTGFVEWSPEEAGEFVFWLSEEVPFALLDGDTELNPEETGGAAMGCETLAVVHHKFDVEAKSYTIEIGPAADIESVSFVAEHAGEDHSDHDHSE